ncbi:major facilitator superfamily domain-containing protein 4A-like [Argopecten irradians]|uniref:major facilitator superfamily domain-containing protein 4A-like n=1 Tax=Argopecten irradians TaxID=31199 RepID=UPI00371F15C1
MTCKMVSKYLTSKTLYSFICCSTSFVLGWLFSMDGPSLLELQFNTGVTFTMASSYITTFNVANVLGTLGVGFFLYKRVNAFLVITVGLAVAAASVVAIPFCLSYIPMMISHICFGVSTGGLDILTVAEMSALWGSDTEVPMHALYFASSLGAVISPICTTPFLKNLEDVHLFQEDMKVFQENGNIDSVVNSSVLPCKNSSIIHLDTKRCLKQQALEAPSRLYIPYSLSAGLAIIVLLSAFVIFILYINNKFVVTYNHDNTSDDQKRVSGKFLYFVLLITGLMSSLDTSIEECLSDFLPSFCVTQIG